LLKICVVTLYTDEIAQYARLGAVNKERYAARHRYTSVTYTHSFDPGRSPAFSKLTAIGNHLAEHDWVFWTDADSLVMNPATRLEWIIRRAKDRDMILTWEKGGAPVNTGQWLVRNTAWSRAALERLAAPDSPTSRPQWFEQGALVAWLQEDPSQWRQICVLHPRVMNSTPGRGHYPKVDLRASRYRTGDFIIHFWPLARRTGEIVEAMHRHHQLALTHDAGLRRMLQRVGAAVTRIRYRGHGR
jgi:hypothetical protein